MFIESLKNEQVAHIYEEDYSTKTAMIPFCEFGGNMSVMGVKIDQFDDPVCNSFRPKIVMDQLCYQVDPNEYKNKIDLQGDFTLSLFINYNEDKEMALENNETMAEDNVIRIDTIGNHFMEREANSQ